MVMFQVDDLAAEPARCPAAGVREVFEVSLAMSIEEVHLHPADMRGAIVVAEHAPAGRVVAVGRPRLGAAKRAAAS